MSIHPEWPDSDSTHRSVAGDVFLRQEPDEEEEDEEEDEGDRKDDGDDGEGDDGYSESVVPALLPRSPTSAPCWLCRLVVENGLVPGRDGHPFG